MILVDGTSVTASPRIVLGAVLVAHLATGLTAAVLPALGEAFIEIGPDDTLIQLGAADVLHAVEGVLVSVVLDEAEAARCLLEAVEAHDQAFDLAAFAKQLVDLLLGGVEGQIADVERGGIFELVLWRGRAAADIVVAIAVASTLLGCRVGARLVKAVDGAAQRGHRGGMQAVGV